LRRINTWVVAQRAVGQFFQPGGFALGDQISPLVDGLTVDSEEVGEGLDPTAEVVERVYLLHGGQVKQTHRESVKSHKRSGGYTSVSYLQDGTDTVRLADLVKSRREALGLTQEELGRRIGVTKASISLIESGRTRSLRGATLGGLARELGVTTDDLLGRRRLPTTQRQPHTQVVPETEQPRRVKVVGTARLLPNGSWTDTESDCDGAVDWQSDDPEAYAVRIIGDSLHPRIRSGEFVVCEPGHEVVAGDEVVVSVHDGSCYVRELAYQRGGQIAFNGLTNGHGRMTLDESDIKSIHFIAGIVKATRFRDN
jgi:phage repressor protein C with HTH and peptisase S24 domain